MDNFIKKITRQAGDLIIKKYRKVGVKYTKANPADIVTEADLIANKFLVREIKKKYPEHGMISEELGEEKTKAEFIWIIDPLDGTRNFATQTPIWCTMVALLKRKQIILSAVYDPIHNEFFYAKKGKGAYLNNKRIRCSRKKDLNYSYGDITVFNNAKVNKLRRPLLELSKKISFHTSSTGSFGISSTTVASGRRDWMVRGVGPKIWDFAPNTLILAESGCKVTNLKGAPWQISHKDMLAANPVLHKKLLKVVNR